MQPRGESEFDRVVTQPAPLHTGATGEKDGVRT